MDRQEIEANLRSTNRVLEDVGGERLRQTAKWGVQNHPDTRKEPRPLEAAERMASNAQAAREQQEYEGPDWDSILTEEFYEARAEAFRGNLQSLREELIQVAAVAVAWVEDIDRRGNANER